MGSINKNRLVVKVAGAANPKLTEKRDVDGRRGKNKNIIAKKVVRLQEGQGDKMVIK